MSNQAHSFNGNMTRDPEVRNVPTKAGDTVLVASFAVAVNGRRPEDTVFFECEAWGAQAEFVNQWFKKGKPIDVNDAEARMDTWDDKTTGEKRSRMKFKVNRCSFAAGGKPVDSETEETTPTPAAAPKATSAPKSVPNRRPRQTAPVEEENDEQIPF